MMKSRIALLLLLLLVCACRQDPPRRIEVLFLGHESRHHDSDAYAPNA